MSLVSLLQKVFFYCLFVVLCFWFACVLKQQDAFQIKTIKVVAAFNHLNPKSLQKTIKPYTRTSFFSFDSEKTGKSLKQLPWIYSVSIKKIWPNTVVIKLLEQKPAAEWNGTSLLNFSGDIFSPKKSSFPKKFQTRFSEFGK